MLPWQPNLGKNDTIGINFSLCDILPLYIPIFSILYLQTDKQ